MNFIWLRNVCPSWWNYLLAQFFDPMCIRKTLWSGSILDISFFHFIFIFIFRHHYHVENVWLYSFLFILGLAGGIISIVLSSYTCVVCCQRSNVGPVIYNPGRVGKRTAQNIPQGNLEAVIVTQPAAAAATTTSQQLPPSYNTVAQLQMHHPPSAPPMVEQKQASCQQ